VKIERVGILHPGAMGTSVAATVQNGGYEVWWVPEGRSRATRDRAREHGFRPAQSLGDLAASCHVLLSVCPPASAGDVASAVVDAGFRGLFVDANAISPRRVQVMGKRLGQAGVDFVDGGILGLPAPEPGMTRIYLSGPRSGEVAGLFAAGPVGAVCLEGEVGRASALKMCYAGYTKGTRALLWAVLATAESLGVRSDLEGHWEYESPGAAGEAHRKVLATTPKAWRWVAEMEEIAATFAGVGMPGGFHAACGEVLEKLVDFKDADVALRIDDVLETLLSRRGETRPARPVE
jgi:3-hydroxyisobutyrate dehydrogenase-like beta-hydroxyacid dehydrogenase